MNCWLRWTLLLFVGAIGCAAAQAQQRPGTDLSEILSQSPGYHLLTMAERNADARAFLLHESSKTNPSIVHADFDGDGHPDYAVLLKHDGDEKAKFSILLCSQNANCRSVYELDVTGVVADMYLRPVSKGSLLSEPGVQVNYFEKAAVVYYWAKKTRTIEIIQTED